MGTTKKTTDPLHSADSAAELLAVRPSTIRWWWSIGKLRRTKVGRLTRVRESELLALIKPEQLMTKQQIQRR
jgi:excisionase family DNA binding protein